ncbi:MAG: hypothetical protein ACKVWR_21795 [Acidimicrobiales bacterium]
MSYYAGVDFDTHGVHVCLIDEDRPERARAFTWALAGSDALTRLRAVREIRCGWDDVAIVNVEWPAGRFHTAAALLPFHGAIVNQVPSGVIVWRMRPMEWRRHVGLAGNASKQEVADLVARHVPAADWSQDLCDAWCLARAAQVINEEAIREASA